MLGIKRLYTFMLQRFVPLLVMTFFICLFIVLMQFLWKFLDDLVGKGLGIRVIGELFFYAALSMVPTALPLAVLLASLMTFGNLGEKFELTAMKASGISLFRVMRPLIVLMTLVSIGAFFFQNNVLPVSQTKMWTLMFSMRQTKPEVEIPEGAFYDQIPGINLFISKKNPDSGMLYDMIIYDVSKGFDNSRIILSDSGHLSFTEDKTHLFLKLYKGEQFENLRDNSLGASTQRYMPFRRESFIDKEIYIPFDANFNRMDESGMRSQYVGQNITELRHSIDSISQIVDSIGDIYGKEIKEQPYMDIPYYRYSYIDGKQERHKVEQVTVTKPIDIDSLFAAPTPGYAKTYINQALVKAQRQRQDFEFKSAALLDQARSMRIHDIEMQKKFKLSFACLIFFFIGAPLGAIIRKGGIGTPLVVSVILFIIYYIIDNTGFKMAREGHWQVWQGMWLSSAVLLPLGIFFTYKAVGDSAVFNIDAYINFFNKLLGKKTKRSLELKEVIMNEVETPEAIAKLDALSDNINAYLSEINAKPRYARLLARIKTGSARQELVNEVNTLIDYLSNSRDAHVINFLNEIPFDITYKALPQIAEVITKLKEIYNNNSLTSNNEYDG